MDQYSRVNPALKGSSSSSDDNDNRDGAASVPPESPEVSVSDIDNAVSEDLSAQMKTALLLTEKVLTETSIDGIVEFIKQHPNLKIITMVGAGISTAAGIPDFRSPGTGIYDNLKKYDLPYPAAIFELSYFKRNPEPFFHLAREMFPHNNSYEPTKAHFFIKLLQDKGLLLRHYTQNIDNLDRRAGILENKLIEAHGTFNTSHCMKCKAEYNLDWLKDQIKEDTVLKCTKCKDLVKPDIVFFGETLPRKFYQNISTDFNLCDLLIIMGSSLAVEPFASLVTRVKNTCPRLMINATQAGDNLGLLFEDVDNGKDVLWLGDCDEGCRLLAEKLGWKKELEKCMQSKRLR